MNVFKLRTTLGFTVAAALSVFASAASAESLVAINSNNQVSVFDSSNAVGAVFNTILVQQQQVKPLLELIYARQTTQCTA